MNKASPSCLSKVHRIKKGVAGGVRGSTDQLSLDIRRSFPEVDILKVGLKE